VDADPKWSVANFLLAPVAELKEKSHLVDDRSARRLVVRGCGSDRVVLVAVPGMALCVEHARFQVEDRGKQAGQSLFELGAQGDIAAGSLVSPAASYLTGAQFTVDGGAFPTV
jgi:hypothetical protein